MLKKKKLKEESRREVKKLKSSTNCLRQNASYICFVQVNFVAYRNAYTSEKEEEKEKKIKTST